MKNKNAQKYFTQKNLSAIDIICIAVAVIGAIVATFVWGGGPIGIPMFVFSIMVLVFLRSTRIQDQEIDKLVQKMFSENCGDLEDKNMICTFYLSKENSVKGKDGKLRSPQYVVSYYETLSAETKITVYYFNLIESMVEKENILVSNSTKMHLNEQTLMLSSGRKKIYFLSSNDNSFNIPVTVDDVESARILEKLCN